MVSKKAPASPCHRVIGIDFDNTIIDYDRLFHRLARALSLIPASVKGKTAIRDHIRACFADGEILWQRLQAAVYGRLIHRARVMPGVRDFLARCREDGNCIVYIVSHKTRFAAQDRNGRDLRAAALDWLRDKEFLDSLLGRQNIFFEDTRQMKIARIRELGCTHFIDDLEEMFLEPAFPEDVEKILYAPAESSAQLGVKVFSSWQALGEYFFHGAENAS